MTAEYLKRAALAIRVEIKARDSWFGEADRPFMESVADLLDNHADTTCDCGVDESALAVARAYLGGACETPCPP